MAASRVPCSKCGAMNSRQDPVCLGCGARFTVPPAPAPARSAPQLAPDEMCTRCFSVLLPARQFDTRNTLGGVDGGVGPQYAGSLGTTGMAARELSGLLWVMDFFANLVLGSILKKNFDRRLRAALLEAPNSLCCPSCRAIVRR